MKKYDHEKKEWVTLEEYERRQKQRTNKLCRGNKPHDFVLVLPIFVSFTDSYNFNPNEYYRIMDERYEFIENQKKELEKLGIINRGWNRKETRLYMCAVCKKQKYENHS